VKVPTTASRNSWKLNISVLADLITDRTGDRRLNSE
jgi:hypothetical protein